MKVIIDRLEEDLAVIELEGEMLRAPRALFDGCKEGDIVEITRLGRACDSIDPDEKPHDIFERLRCKRFKSVQADRSEEEET